MATKIKVLLVDDHSLVRRGFRRMLEDEADIVVIGEASNGDEAVRLARELVGTLIADLNEAPDPDARLSRITQDLN